jgi:hypothetical protein
MNYRGTKRFLRSAVCLSMDAKEVEQLTATFQDGDRDSKSLGSILIIYNRIIFNVDSAGLC